MVDHLLLVSVVMSRDQSEITIIVRMMLGSVRAGANIFHFNLISLCLYNWVGRRLGSPSSNNISGTNRLSEERPAPLLTPGVTSPLHITEPETPLYWSPGSARRLWLVQERWEGGGGGVQVTGSCRRLETGNTGGNIKHSDFLINYLREINSPLVMDLSLHCHCHWLRLTSLSKSRERSDQVSVCPGCFIQLGLIALLMLYFNIQQF